MGTGCVSGAGAGGMAAAQVALLSKVLADSAARTQALMKALVAVDLQNKAGAEKMAIAAEIIEAFSGGEGGLVDVVA